MSKNTINLLIFWVGTKCNLQCRACTNLIPYREQVSFDAEKIIRNLEYVANSVEICHIQIQGGEPLTHPQLDEILTACESLPLPKIELATNGTLMPGRRCIDAMKRLSDRLIYRISDYPCVDEEKRRQIADCLRREGIDVSVYHFAAGNGMWYDGGEPDRPYHVSTLMDYKECPNRRCWTLADDYLSICARMLSLRKIRNYDHVSMQEDSILNVTEMAGEDFTLQLEHFKENYHSGVPFSCGYCRVDKHQIPAAEQMTREELARWEEIRNCRSR